MDYLAYYIVTNRVTKSNIFCLKITFGKAKHDFSMK